MLDVATDWTGPKAKALRKRLGLTQAEFAPVIGYERRESVSEMETRETPPPGPVCRVLDYIETFGVLPPEAGEA